MPTKPAAPEPSRLVIVVDLPQELRHITRLVRSLALAWPKSVIETNPKQKTVRITGWFIHITSNQPEEGDLS